MRLQREINEVIKGGEKGVIDTILKNYEVGRQPRQNKRSLDECRKQEKGYIHPGSPPGCLIRIEKGVLQKFIIFRTYTLQRQIIFCLLFFVVLSIVLHNSRKLFSNWVTWNFLFTLVGQCCRTRTCEDGMKKSQKFSASNPKDYKFRIKHRQSRL